MLSQPPRDRISAIIPLFNEEAGVHHLYRALIAVLETLRCQWEIVFIDDGSTDGTLTVLRELNSLDPRIKIIALSRNFGKERAIAAGLRYVEGDAAIIMDGDLQHPPALLAEFVARWREGYDVVYGQRIDRSQLPSLRNLMPRAYYTLFRSLSRVPLPEGAGDFRLLSRKAINAMNQLTERARFNKGLYSWIGFNAIGVPFTPVPRRHGTPKWKHYELFEFAIDGVTAFSTVPLRIWSYLGFAISAAALGYGLFFLVRTLIFGVDTAGFPSLIVSIMFLSGVQLISLGVLGEYLGRVYEEVKGRPLFLVAEAIGFETHGVKRAHREIGDDATFDA